MNARYCNPNITNPIKTPAESSIALRRPPPLITRVVWDRLKTAYRVKAVTEMSCMRFKD